MEKKKKWASLKKRISPNIKRKLMLILLKIRERLKYGKKIEKSPCQNEQSNEERDKVLQILKRSRREAQLSVTNYVGKTENKL